MKNCKNCKKIIMLGIHEVFTREYKQNEIGTTTNESLKKGLCEDCYNGIQKNTKNPV